ncbi:DUF262 domain-containing protein [Mucilaginibacter sp. NFR10]|uniref:DUF262 domain-containing protein n=1 Tax=Mucilaginibacter sp. NFR10 TaxID=1566292 RepID=UPI0008713587|nr:DUF262 domain-containing protein [Mucilaginibacter sp. NFR10]SCW41261.1 Protein of unknown function DUF262 [Mucilaginibacter sp. NFR10]
MPKRLITQEEQDSAEEQILQQQVFADYDTKEYPIEVIVQKYEENKDDDLNELFIPTYQRDFVWDENRQSKFIESILIGLPIPYIFTADRGERFEIVDGSQRIRCLAAYINDELVLKNLERLPKLNGMKFSDLILSRQRRFKRKTLRLIELSEKASLEVTNDLFERINTGSDILRKMEVRKGAFAGKFYDFVTECSQNDLFVRLCPISEKVRKREEAQELVLRFFAYSDNYLKFKHRVDEFLNDFLKENKSDFDEDRMRGEFLLMLKFVETYFPYGFTKGTNSKTTPRVRFEAISVGVNLALRINPNLIPHDLSWMDSQEFKLHTRSDASNSRPKIKGRIEFVRDNLLK